MHSVAQFLKHASDAVQDALSRLLQPGMPYVGRWQHAFHEALARIGVPPEWQGRLILALWVLLMLVVFRLLQGWWRVLAVVLIGLVLSKIYGLLPPVCEPASGTVCA